MRPKKPRTNDSSGSREYWRSQSTRFRSTSSKNSLLSFGKYACVVVTPHLNVPASASILPMRISKSAVLPTEFGPTKATLSPFLSVKLTLFNTFSPSIVFVRPLTCSSWSPASRSGVKAM